VVTRNTKPRTNRYKKSGKGSFVLAALIVTICLVLVIGYFVKQTLDAKNSLSAVQQTQSTQQTPLSSAPQRPTSSALVPISPQQVEVIPPARQEPYYTGDLAPERLPPPKPRPGVTGKAALAIVIDDMGSSLQEAQALVSIGVPITFAIIPGLRHDRAVAEYATQNGLEILVHMPMQSREYPRRRLEENGLLLAQSDDEIRSRVLGYLQQLPGAVGANNHMGSGFTEQRHKMQVVLEVLQERGLFFLDSITTPQTTGLKVAAALQMRHVRRHVFLDNEQQESYIRGQLEQAVARARKLGYAVAIGHPHPMTLEVLAKTLPELQKQGITLVPVSSLAH